MRETGEIKKEAHMRETGEMEKEAHTREEGETEKEAHTREEEETENEAHTREAAQMLGKARIQIDERRVMDINAALPAEPTRQRMMTSVLYEIVN